MKYNIFDKNEEDRGVFLNTAKTLVSSKTGIIKILDKNPFFNDEPKFFQYFTKICDTSFFSDVKNEDRYAGGFSIDEENAKTKALGEAIERYCLSIYKNDDLITASYNNLNGALNPNTVVNFSEKQMKEIDDTFKFDENTSFRWVKGYSPFLEKSIFLPVQLIYVPYYYDNEPIIRFPITTGAACSSSLSGAIYRGICEVVERDAYMITYLNRLPLHPIDTEKIVDEGIQRIHRLFEEYHLEWYLYDITTDVPIPVFMSILIDRSCSGPAVSVGLKCSLNISNAMIGSAEEAQSSRLWIREETLKHPNFRTINYSYENFVELEKRGLYWANGYMIQHLDFLLENEKIEYEKNINNNFKDSIKKLRCVMSAFKEKGIDFAIKEVTTPDVAEFGFRVVKVIIPNLQPLYLDERFRYFGGKRLYEIPKLLGYVDHESNEENLNQIPHPFL